MNRRFFRGIFFAVAVFIMAAGDVFGEGDGTKGKGEQAFPEWMDKVDFGTRNRPPPGQTGFSEPVEPADPDPAGAEKRRESGRAGGGFRFRPPKMPDFSAIRKKSVRTVYRKTASGTLEQVTETVEIVNPAGLRLQASALASECARLEPGAGKARLEDSLRELLATISRQEELAAILGIASDGLMGSVLATVPADLPSAKKIRLNELRRTLINAPSSIRK